MYRHHHGRQRQLCLYDRRAEMGCVDMEKSPHVRKPTWGIDVPSCRLWGSSPTFGSLMLFFFRKSTTRSYYLMNFSQRSLRGAEIWHSWKQHHVIECFWKIMKSIFQLRSMHLQGDGLYTALLIKVFAYLLALRLKAQGGVPN